MRVPGPDRVHHAIYLSAGGKGFPAPPVHRQGTAFSKRHNDRILCFLMQRERRGLRVIQSCEAAGLLTVEVQYRMQFQDPLLPSGIERIRGPGA